MRSTLVSSLRLNRWVTWIMAAAGAELCWFALLHPLVPVTMRGAVVEALLPLLIVGYILPCGPRLTLARRRATINGTAQGLSGSGSPFSVWASRFFRSFVYTTQHLLSHEFGR